MDDPLLGIEVGKYRLERLLGKGGMGRVYAAIQPDLGTHVAIKVLAEDAAGRPELVERFFSEARAISKIRHESIVNVLDLVRMPGGRPAIVMELVDGQTLRDVLRPGRAPLGGIIQLMIEVMSALAAAHAIGIVHRDIKPDNIMVTASGHAKVLDFGIAKLAVSLHGPRTQTGVLLGTPEYMSPEQVSNGTIDGRSDIYSAGVVLFEAVAGRRPFDGPSDFELMRAQLETPPPSVRALRPELPAALEQVIVCALAKERGHRFANANAMANALHGAAASVSPEEWRGLVPGARMYPRSMTPPAPQSSAQPQPDESLAHVTVRHRPSEPAVTVAERPSAAGRSRERASDPVVETRPPRWSRIAVPLIAACAGGGLVAVLLVARGGSGSAPTPPTTTTMSPTPTVPTPTVPTPSAPIDAAVIAVVDVVDAAVADAALVAPDATITARVPALAKKPSPPPPDAAPRVAPDPPAPSGFGTFKADYDPTNFDPIAYLPKVRARARAIFDDAEIHSWSCGATYFDGRVDFNYNRNCRFEFWSRTRGGYGTDVELCAITFVLEPKEINVYSDSSQWCPPNLALGGQPRCKLRVLWDRARAAHTRLEPPGSVAWTPGKWKLEAHDADEGDRYTGRFDDNCE